MKIARNNQELSKYLLKYRENNPQKQIGFVPTMGALHDGHMSLLNKAIQTSDYVVCSVFVNPTQFNDASDLEKYPRTVAADIELLEKNGCDLVFIPSEKDIYPKTETSYNINLNGLDKVMEGKFRTGHFEGVCMVVERLFKLVKPDFGFFGKKDFQQVAILKHMVNVKNLNVKIIECPIKREKSGLAMSSRNALLSEKEKKDASIIYKTLKKGKKMYDNGGDLEQIYDKMMSVFKTGFLKLEYLEIVDNETLQSIEFTQPKMSACIAAYCGKVRLIDNIQF